MAKKLGFIDSSGKAQKSVIVTKVGAVIGNTELVAKLVDQCMVKKGSLEDSTFYFVKCFYEKTPKHNLII